jgi:mannose/fructose/N-acetylgalactosamine-specific phosphotransferase system component IIC
MKTNALMTLGDITSLAIPAAVSNGVSNKLAAMANLQTMHKTHQAAARENAHALLAYSAMENAAMLSNFEAVCTCIAPSGELRYRQIADTYAMGATQRIAGW